MTRFARRMTVVIAIACGLIGTDLVAQGRRMKKIEKPAPPATAAPADAVPPASAVAGDEQCRSAVARIAAAYGPRLDPMLHPRFPNRTHFLDTLQRIDLRVSHLRLEIVSIESMQITPGPDGDLECVADVRTRLTFDDPATGKRVVDDPGRAEWRLLIPRLEPLP